MRTSVKKLVTAVSTSVALMGAGHAAAEIQIGIAGPMTWVKSWLPWNTTTCVTRSRP